jgi:aspartate racemase
VPLLLGAGDVTVPLVDSAEVLAAACVKACT